MSLCLAAAEAAPSKPPCKYGKLCYQSNEAHLQQFYHEPKEEDKTDKKKKPTKKQAAEKVCVVKKHEKILSV